jgi:hypothetical protein
MSEYYVWRDDEEVEVGWLTWKLDSLRHFMTDFWRGCRETDWLRYFSGNGRGDIVSKEFSGFSKCSGSTTVVGQWSICIKRGKGRYPIACYYRNVVLRDPESVACAVVGEIAWSDYIKNRVAMEGHILDRYAFPNCACRLGFHRRCPLHFKTRN